jgi:hypothetical protein
MQMLNPWFAISYQATRLAWEAQNVMVLRLMRLASGGASGTSEANRMVTEKLSALAEAQTVATAGAISGNSGPVISKKILNVYKKRVRGNKRRLSK